MMFGKTVAIFVDAGFFARIFLKTADPEMTANANDIAKAMWNYWIQHVDKEQGEQLYRIFYYDCPPLTHKAHHPITDKLIDFSQSTITKYNTSLHQALIHQPFVACRMGQLNYKDAEWGFLREDKIHKFKKLIRGESQAKDIDPKNVNLKPKQKGVDMKLGIDISSVVLKKLANKVVLISGDSDFVPAAKMARVEGAHFILDSMGRDVNVNLAEHVDGLKSFTDSIQPLYKD